MELNIAYLANQKELSHFELYHITPKGKVEADRVNVRAFLSSRGFYLYRTSINKHIYIRIMDNIVAEVGKKDLIDCVLDFIQKNEPRKAYEGFLSNVTKFFNDDFLRTLDAKQVEFRKDRKDAMQIYYRNCILKITKTSINTFLYSEMTGYIWESQILQRDFKICEIIESDFKRFVWNISNHDENRFKSLCSVLGFLVHNYKSPAYCPAVILNDEVISDNPEGGTGKGILLKAVEQFLTTVTIEGKTFNFDKSFVYQAVNADTKLLSFQDVNKSFDFERLFSVMTDGINVEKKGLQSVHYRFEDTPKVAITTNYAIKGTGNSNERRRFELEISQYYNKSRRPTDDFGKMFFVEWEAEDWLRFDTFIADCCQFFLNNGLIDQVLINLPEKRLRGSTHPDFLEYMEGKMYIFDGGVQKGIFFSEFIREYPDQLRNKYFSKNVFGKWVSEFAAYYGYKQIEDYITLGIRHYRFVANNTVL